MSTASKYLHRVDIRCRLELDCTLPEAMDSDRSGYADIVRDEWDHEMKLRGIA
jgi:hypothetical protein